MSPDLDHGSDAASVANLAARRYGLKFVLVVTDTGETAAMLPAGIPDEMVADWLVSLAAKLRQGFVVSGPAAAGGEFL